ncbi:MAG: LysR family transcriptional regulator [Rhodoplanes sp.]|uniref:LysR family transcriptional regulator n=1 Tax=Rhodoplanes sp. TaxID=1968906 RepID=UPI0017C43148|nr:LysR family transcriptional regulator [Rhodoplanes sp.]NVO13662.1 LysR family transcriptional regulator [Rhodoplanes sp.]
MDISVRQLVAFLTVANLRSFTATAKVMHLTQSGVSALIRELEERSGVKLFDRTSHSVRLSRAGEDFLPYAQRAVEHVRAAERCTADLRDHRAGQVRVAGAPLIACTLLPQMMSAFAIAHPTVRVQLVDVPMSELQTMVGRSDVDLGLGPERGFDADVSGAPLFTTPVSVICPPGHRFASRVATWCEVRDEPVIVVGQEMIDHIAFEFGGARFTVALVVNHISTALGLAAVGRGVVLAGPFIAQLASAYGLVICPLGEPVLNRKMMVYQHGTRALSPAAEVFKRFMMQFVRDNDPNAVATSAEAPSQAAVRHAVPARRRRTSGRPAAAAPSMSCP